MSFINELQIIQKKIETCRACPNMCGTPVHGPPINSQVMLIGQAPGPHEASFGRPFAYTSGKTLFKWFLETGLDENLFRKKVYIAAIARCYPGKSLKGDRVPTRIEIDQCSLHLAMEVNTLKPDLIMAVGRLAITEVLGAKKFTAKNTLADVVGIRHRTIFHGHVTDVVCLPHPSGVSRWPKTKIGSLMLKNALSIIKNHPAWQQINVLE